MSSPGVETLWRRGRDRDSRGRVVRRGQRELCPLSRATSATCVPNFGADTTTERSEGVVEAAGVEREIGVITNLLMARDFWG